jgi:hypothetical protein
MGKFPKRGASFSKACYALWLVKVKGETQTEAAIQTKLNVGTVNHIVHGRRFVNAYPRCPENLDF